VQIVATALLFAALAGVSAQAPTSVAPASSVATTLVPVAARIIPRGTQLSAEDIAEVEAPASAGGSITRKVAPGWIARRRIDLGEPLREPAVMPPMAVLPGDSVDAVYRDAGVALRLHGTAMTSAAIGDRVVVKVDLKRRLEGTLTAPRLVVLR
jgi:flagella basal body P-ring formation protein FlgA